MWIVLGGAERTSPSAGVLTTRLAWADAGAANMASAAISTPANAIKRAVHRVLAPCLTTGQVYGLGFAGRVAAPAAPLAPGRSRRRDVEPGRALHRGGESATRGDRTRPAEPVGHDHPFDHVGDDIGKRPAPDHHRDQRRTVAAANRPGCSGEARRRAEGGRLQTQAASLRSHRPGNNAETQALRSHADIMPTPGDSQAGRPRRPGRPPPRWCHPRSVA